MKGDVAFPLPDSSFTTVVIVRFSLVPGARENGGAPGTQFEYAFNLPKMWGIRAIF